MRIARFHVTVEAEDEGEAACIEAIMRDFPSETITHSGSSRLDPTMKSEVNGVYKNKRRLDRVEHALDNVVGIQYIVVTVPDAKREIFSTWQETVDRFCQHFENGQEYYVKAKVSYKDSKLGGIHKPVILVRRFEDGGTWSARV